LRQLPDKFHSRFLLAEEIDDGICFINICHLKIIHTFKRLFRPPNLTNHLSGSSRKGLVALTECPSWTWHFWVLVPTVTRALFFLDILYSRFSF
jgi:hypothetical protein